MPNRPHKPSIMSNLNHCWTTTDEWEATGGGFPRLDALKLPMIDEIAVINGVPQNVTMSTFDISKLKPRSFLKWWDDGCVLGRKMRKRAVKLNGNLGLADGERMLIEQDKIPSKFRSFEILLPGTVLRGSNDLLFIPYLYWVPAYKEGKGIWQKGFRLLDFGGFYDNACLACIE